MEQKVSKVDYSKSVIYKLCCKDPTITDIYIGSTTNMKGRKQGHKNRCNNPNSIKYNYKVYQTIREFGGFDNWDMILVEYVNATSKQELEKEERVVIELLQPTLNSSIPTRTQKEWVEENKEKMQEYHKEYRQDNKTKLSEKSKKYREQNKEKLSETQKKYYEKNQEKILEKKKKYREENKTEINEKQKIKYEQNKEKFKKYYVDNKEKIHETRKNYYEKQKEKIKCEFCECVIKKYNIKRHQKTVKCKKFQLIEN